MQILFRNQPLETERFIKGVLFLVAEMIDKKFKENPPDTKDAELLADIELTRGFVAKALDSMRSAAPNIAKCLEFFEQNGSGRQTAKMQPEILTSWNSGKLKKE